ncbi:hypothetical protein KKC1_16370 [Calderihabitans maritimus]|uniref:Uncharacterized protein n=1 Tax=Calderihabitans maritimus TaxID=1246530 RepID=A0A1Z5HSI1_9FIRM|nr:hypothetical protein KKC1_16370 [Calderihabitans maritimus]
MANGIFAYNLHRIASLGIEKVGKNVRDKDNSTERKLARQYQVASNTTFSGKTA